ncbi:hypothetical protein D915_000222 [Fasciola hepatica]|uniref:Uncharacterized protein n=1 Tax=Fasciola hepatica TaxID=6192 RepID=A0A4E0RS07_FASHE|nr:hypothetical protein D915_000222 [Fasciola hepatica]
MLANRRLILRMYHSISDRHTHSILVVFILLLCFAANAQPGMYWLRKSQEKEYLRLRNLDIGPCLHEGDSFCTRRVANSMCSTEKNECFCKPGYVSIQESYGITCKTLLTNLKCQVDADCVHIFNSACHPGAGLCACPSGTIYVAQDHACQQMAEYESNIFCNKCRQVNGMCYKRDKTSAESPTILHSQTNSDDTYHAAWYQTHRSIRSLLLGYPYGCLCPYNTAMPLATPRRTWITNETHKKLPVRQADELDRLEDLPQWSFCKAIFVNVGEYCNNIDVLCRAKFSHCIQNEDGSNRRGQSSPFVFTCTCAPGYVPVYQNHLGYYECFQQIAANHTDCSACIKTGGRCFSMNLQNPTATGCLCPHDRAPGIASKPIGSDDSHGIPNFASSDVGSDSCTESLAEVSCFRSHLEVCYRPPTQPPYNRLSNDLASQKAFAFVTDARPNLVFDDTCVLTPTTKHPFSLSAGLSPKLNESMKEDSLWCLVLDWRNDPGRQPCAVKVTEYMSGHLYSGYLAIVTDAEYQSPMRSMLFQFTCKTNNEIPQRVPGQVFERAWISENHDIDNSWSKVDIALELVNQTGQSIETAFEYTPIRLRAQLHDQSGKYHALHMEACYASQASVEDQDMGASHEYPVVIKGCPTRLLPGRSAPSRQETRPSPLAGLLESPAAFETDIFPVSHDASAQMFCPTADDCSRHPINSSMHRAMLRRSLDYPIGRPDPDQPVGSNANTRGRSTMARPVEYKVYRLQFRCVIRLCTERACCPTRLLPGRSAPSRQETRPSPLAGLLESPAAFETDIFPVSHDASAQMFCPTADDCSRHPINSSMHRAMLRRSLDYPIGRPDPDQPVGSNANTRGRSTMARPVEYKVYRLQFRCVIRLCTERAWCCWPVLCGSRQGETLSPRTTFQPPNLRFVTRTVHLNVLQLVTAAHEPAQTKAKDEQCTSFICTTGLHTLLLVGLVGLLTCVMGIVGLMLARRYQLRYDRTSYNPHNQYIAPKPLTAQTYRQPTVQPDVLTNSTTVSKLRSPCASGTPGNPVPTPGDANWWLTLHAYTNAQLTDTLPLPDPRSDRNRNHTPTFLSLPRCSCSEIGGHLVSANVGAGSRIPVAYAPSSPVHLTSFHSDDQGRKSEQPLLFTPACDSSTSSLKGAAYLQLTEPDQLQNSADRSTPSEITWTPWPGNGHTSDECSSVPMKEYPCLMMARSVPPCGESSSAYSTFDGHDACART